MLLEVDAEHGHERLWVRDVGCWEDLERVNLVDEEMQIKLDGRFMVI